MILSKSLLCLCLGLGFSAKAQAALLAAPDMGLLKEQSRIKEESEKKIQNDILDLMLGKGKSTVFVDVEMEVKIQHQQANQSGMGLAEKYKEKLGNRTAGEQTTFVLPGIPKPKTISQGSAGTPDKPESLRAMQSQQIKGVEEERFSIVPEFKRLLVTVIHDDAVLLPAKDQKQIEEIRAAIVAAMGQYQLKPDQVVFRPVRFSHAPAPLKMTWKEDIQRPEVYLPLLFASLLALALLFLFGPLATFFRKYVAAMLEKPGAEVNIDSKMEAPDEGGGKENPLDENGQLDITWQNKQPVPPPEEDETMKKFEPFTYINEENMKRLVYMFLLRKEEPWIIAVVASYLRPDYARQLLTALPLDLQAKVALEALIVRQVTREQVQAIDNEVKENVDFVVGGVERLLSLLDDADSATRNNILNYLKNDKPMIYERLRKQLLVFEDIAGFPDRTLQTLVRELKTENMAKALQNAPPEVINKFLANMSAGAASLLKESMEYTQKMTPEQVDQERSGIIEQIKVLEKEGKIVVREKPKDIIDLESLEEGMRSQTRRQQRFASPSGQAVSQAQAPATEESQNYYAAGASYYAAGQFEQALPYFEYALSQDQGLWQAHQYMGHILVQLGRGAEALAHYEKSLETHPDPELQEQVESLKAQV